MKQKKLVSILCLILVCIMVLSLVIGFLPIRAFAVTQSDIDALRAKKNEISQRVAEAQERLTGLQNQQAGVLEQKSALEEQNNAAQQALELITQEIAMYDQMISEKNQELQEAVLREQAQLSRYRSRVRAMEENGGYNIIALIVNSTSFSELLTSLDDVGEIMESDKNLEHEYRAARQQVEQVKAEYEQVRAECGEKQMALQNEKAQIEAQISTTNAMLEALSGEIAAAMEVYEAEAAAEEQAAREVTELIRQYEEEQRRAREAAEAAARAAALAQQQQQQAQQQAQGGGGGGGETYTQTYTQPTVQAFSGFSWPVPSSYTVTGRYGENRGSHFHAGIDIDGYGHDGGPINAAAAGTVIRATSSSGYGNYVIIDHGNGYQTLYAHMSGIAVSVGQYINAGQTVGTLGATGNATGTHCHFEIRINGSTTDPEQYFSGLRHWNC